MTTMENLLSNPQVAQHLLRHTFDVVLIVAECNTIRYVNPAFERISQYEADGIMGKSLKLLDPKQRSGEYFRKVTGEKTLNTTLVYQKKNGDLFYLNTHILPLNPSGSERSFLLIGNDITSYIYQAATMDMLRAELTYLEQEVDTILYNISHNLRAPVATIKGIIELSRVENSGLTIEEYYRLVEKNVNQMDLILSDILRLSLVKNRGLTIKKIDFELLIHSILKSLSKFYPVSSFAVSVAISNKLRPTTYEELLVKSALHPIIENAIQFRKPTDKMNNALHRISISVDNTSEEVILRVSDNGIGITESVQDRVFDIFYKGTLRSKGNGLGLHIVKTAITRLNGQIELKSKRNEGTTLTIRLPLPKY